MIHGVATNLFATNATLAAAGPTLGANLYDSSELNLRFAPLELGEVSTLISVADPQFERLGKRSMWDNAGLDRHIHPAHRNLLTMATAPLYQDTLLHHAKRTAKGDHISGEIQGDVGDTTCDCEIQSQENVLAHHPEIPIKGYDHGNHVGGVFNGVLNLKSRFVKWAQKWLFGERVDTCEEQLT